MLINGKRALAYTARCGAIEKIEGADNIELMNVLGWKVITKIGEFKEGDLCVYFEIDSKLPEKEWSEFMAPKHYKVKTMKLGKFKVISQGLALPVNIFGIDIPNEEGVDVTELLGVTYAVEEDNIRKNKPNPDAKYNAMAARHKNIFKLKPVRWLMKRAWGRKLLFAIFGKKKDSPRGWPTHFPHIHKTDEERCENIPWVLKLTDSLVVTEKLDGTSCTYILEKKGRNKYEFYVLSRKIVVSGRLQIRSWVDKDGNKRKTAEIVADNVYFGESKKDKPANNNNSTPTTSTSYGGYSSYNAYIQAEWGDDDDAQLPF